MEKQTIVHLPGACRRMFFQTTDEFREPKKGEWYFSGSIIEVWQAPNDLSTKYWIAKEIEAPPEYVMLHGMRYKRDDFHRHDKLIVPRRPK